MVPLWCAVVVAIVALLLESLEHLSE